MIRDHPLFRWVCGAAAVWSLMFASITAAIGSHLTSRQWEYLFSAPGKQWFYITLFAAGGCVALAGLFAESSAPTRWLLRHVANPRLVMSIAAASNYRHLVTAGGLFVTGTACFIITVFYLGGPLIEPDLLTNGWLPWMFIGAAFYLAAAVNVLGVDL